MSKLIAAAFLVFTAHFAVFAASNARSTPGAYPFEATQSISIDHSMPSRYLLINAVNRCLIKSGSQTETSVMQTLTEDYYGARAVKKNFRFLEAFHARPATEELSRGLQIEAKTSSGFAPDSGVVCHPKKNSIYLDGVGCPYEVRQLGAQAVAGRVSPNRLYVSFKEKGGKSTLKLRPMGSRPFPNPVLTPTGVQIIVDAAFDVSNPHASANQVLWENANAKGSTVADASGSPLTLDLGAYVECLKDALQDWSPPSP